MPPEPRYERRLLDVETAKRVAGRLLDLKVWFSCDPWPSVGVTVRVKWADAWVLNVLADDPDRVLFPDESKEE